MGVCVCELLGVGGCVCQCVVGCGWVAAPVCVLRCGWLNVPVCCGVWVFVSRGF